MAQVENRIQSAIIKKLQSNGVYCWRNSNAALYDSKLNNGRGGYRYNPQAKRGVADILGILPGGQHLEIEVKTEAGKQSPDQAIHEKRVTELGGVYILARSVKDVEEICTRYDLCDA